MTRRGRYLVAALLIWMVPVGKVLAAPSGPPSARFTYDLAGRLTGVYNLQTDTANCGALNSVCPAYPGAAACCFAGTCGYVENGFCLAGQPVAMSVAPSTITVQEGATAQFTATISNSTDTSVMWFVNSVAGGNGTHGTIDDAGLYVAPAKVPAPASFYVQALSLADYTTYASSLVTVVPQLSISISPLTASVAVGQSQQFTASVTNGTDPGVAWSVNGIPGGNSVVGTVSSAGLYSAPTTMPSPASVQVTATANSNASKVASAAVTITAGAVAVSVSPASASLTVGTTRQFVASVRNATNTAVQWKVNGTTGGGSATGTISTSGLYTAPASPTTATVTAVSSADTSKSAASVVSVTSPISVAVAPATLSIRTGQTQQFTATVKGTTSTAVTWQVVGTNAGSITAAGLYTAPASVPTPASVTIKATSSADTSKSGAATAAVTTSTAVLVSVNPTAATVAPSATQQFTATVQNTTTKTVTWKVNTTPGGNSTLGTVSTAGLYKAPSTPPSPKDVTVTAVSTVDTTRSGSATASVVKPVTVAVSPTTASVQAGTPRQFTATVTNSTNTAVTWLVNGIPGGDAVVGTVSTAGLYQAPSGLPTPVTVSVAAVSAADPAKTAAASVTVTAAAISVSVSPPSATVQVGQSRQFSAAVRGTSNTAVTWKVNGTTGGSSTYGFMTTSGLYTATATVPTGKVSIAAFSTADTTKSATASTTIVNAPPVAVDVSPSYAKVGLSQTQQFVATVTNSPNLTVQWLVNGVSGGDSTNGSIDSSGLYTAPATVPGAPVIVTAVSNADPNATATAEAAVTSTLPVSISLSPSLMFLGIGGGDGIFTATVQNTSDTSVSWYVNGILGGNDQVGRIVDGGYFSPWQPSPVTIAAVSNADRSQVATATIEFIPDPTASVFIFPTEPTVPVGQTLWFRASTDGPPWLSTTVAWSVNGALGGDAVHGTINQYGIYTAPQSVPADPVVVSVLFVDPGVMARTTVTVQPAPAVVVSPATIEVQAGQTQQFASALVGLASTAVTWLVNGAPGGSPAIGTIDANGLFMAPATPPTPATVTVTAVAVADTSKTADASVTITALPPVTITAACCWTSAPSLMETGTTWQLQATVSNASDRSLTYQVNGVAGGTAATGTITSDGHYTAPAVVPSPSTLTITAVSNADPSKSVSGSVTIMPIPVPWLYLKGPSGPMRPCAIYCIQVKKQTTIYAIVAHSLDNRVEWAVNDIPGGNSALGAVDQKGTFTAPANRPDGGIVYLMATLTSSPDTRTAIRLCIQP